MLLCLPIHGSHEFDLNLPKALAEVRHDSWKQHAWPAGFSALFDRAGVLIAGLSVLVATVLFYAIANFDMGWRWVLRHITTLFLLRSLRLCSCSSLRVGNFIAILLACNRGGAIRLSDLRAALHLPHR